MFWRQSGALQRPNVSVLMLECDRVIEEWSDERISHGFLGECQGVGAGSPAHCSAKHKATCLETKQLKHQAHLTRALHEQKAHLCP